MKKTSPFLLVIFVSLLGFQSCKKENHENHNPDENELITTVKITLTPTSGPAISASWKDLTPNEPFGQLIDTLKIDSGMVYTGKVELLDETKSPIIDISAEVKKEADEHLFVYKQVLENPQIIKIEITDKDSKNLPVGFDFTFIAITKGNGKLNVILKHQPGEKDGTPAPGDADLNVEIPFISRGK